MRRCVRRRRKQRQLLLGGLSAATIILAAATVISLWLRQEAADSAEEAGRQRTTAEHSAALAETERAAKEKEAEDKRKEAVRANSNADRATAERDRAEREAGELRRRLGLSYLEAGRRLLFDGHAMPAIPYLVASRAQGIEEPALAMLFARATRNLPIMTWPLPASTLPGRDISQSRAAFSPDGTVVVTASGNTMRLWNTATGSPVTRPITRTSSVTHGSAPMVHESSHMRMSRGCGTRARERH